MSSEEKKYYYQGIGYAYLSVFGGIFFLLLLGCSWDSKNQFSFSADRIPKEIAIAILSTSGTLAAVGRAAPTAIGKALPDGSLLEKTGRLIAEVPSKSNSNESSESESSNGKGA
jgi:hypothetical protein